MKRVGGWLFGGVAGVSLLLFVATGVMWGRSFTEADYFRTHTSPVVGISDSHGVICVWIDQVKDQQGYDWNYFAFSMPWDFSAQPHRFALQDVGSGKELIFPHWALMGATAIFPGAWLFRKFRRAGMKLEGHCRKCGYDLRATPDRVRSVGLLWES